MGTDRKSAYIIRYAIAVVVCISVPLIPWAVLLVLVTVYSLWYRGAYEMLLVGLFFDALYSIPQDVLFLPYTLGIAGLLGLCAYIRPKIAFFEDR